MKIYSNMQRQRVWSKVRYIRARYPRLTLKDAASQITNLRGGNFFPKYFQRLEAGTLGDGLTNDIVEWITFKFDRSFSASFETLCLKKEGVQPRRLGNYYIRKIYWRTAPDGLGNAIRYAIQINGKEKYFSFFDKISIVYFHLEFLDNCKFIRCTDTTALGGYAEYFIEYNGKVFEFIGGINNFGKLLTEVPVTLSEHNLPRMCEFLLNYIEDIGAIFVSTYDELCQCLDLLYENHTIDREAASNIFEPFQACIGESFADSLINFDFISDDQAYYRASLRFNGSFSSYDLATFSVDKSLKDWVSGHEVVYKYAARSDDCEDGKLNILIDFISLSTAGRLLLRLVDHKIVKIVSTSGPAGSFSYNHELNTVVYVFSTNGELNVPKESAQMYFALRQAAIKCVGFEGPSPDNILEYAAYIHGMTLDCLTETCEYIHEMLKHSEHRYNLKDYSIFDDFDEFYYAWSSRPSREDLYLVYANIYDRKRGM